MIQRVRLSAACKKWAGQFSSGMKQRLLIAWGLFAEPQLLLLDEPTRPRGRSGCSLLFTVVPIHFIVHAAQPLMAGSIQSQSGDHFAFGVQQFAVLPTLEGVLWLR